MPNEKLPMQNQPNNQLDVAEKQQVAGLPTETIVITELQHVSKTYTTDGNTVTILDDIDLQVCQGEMLALLGQSGSGKSTMLRLLAGLTEPTAGSVLRHGEPFSGVNPSVSIVFQSFALYPWLTVYENVQVGLINKKYSEKQEQEEIEKVLELIGLSGYENAYPKELSGGMRQRVGFARAIVAKPEILCLDEAFSALDVLTAENLRTELVNLWLSKNRDLKSIFFVTHNISEAVFLASRIVIISSHPGRIKHVIENPMPYPRDYNSKEFQNFVSMIHDAITNLALPDAPPLDTTLSPMSKTVSPKTDTERAKQRIESIPPVTVGEIVGLLEVLEDKNGMMDIFDLSGRIGKEFGQTIAIVKAAEILELVDTPKHDVLFTELGKKFLAGDNTKRKEIFAEQILKLRLFQVIMTNLSKTEHLDADTVIESLSSSLPYDNAEKLFDTIVAWGRYAEIIDYDQDANLIFIPTGT
jgi:NitT/TauT family transport system ATP-binding protein